MTRIDKTTPWHIREADINDYTPMHQVRVAVRENILSDPARITFDDYKVYLEERGKGWVCVQKNVVVGFAIADLIGENIWALFVLPEYEHAGIGTALQKTMLQWYFTQGKETVWLSTSPATRAAAFYEKSGWTPTGMEGNELKFSMTKPPGQNAWRCR